MDNRNFQLLTKFQVKIFSVLYRCVTRGCVCTWVDDGCDAVDGWMFAATWRGTISIYQTWGRYVSWYPGILVFRYSNIQVVRHLGIHASTAVRYIHEMTAASVGASITVLYWSSEYVIILSVDFGRCSHLGESIRCWSETSCIQAPHIESISVYHQQSHWISPSHLSPDDRLGVW